jgi:hypothetical protein
MVWRLVKAANRRAGLPRLFFERFPNLTMGRSAIIQVLHPLHRQAVKIALLLIGAAFLLTGCVSMEDIEASQEQRSDVVASLTPGQTFRQGFSSPNAGLKQVDVWLRPADGQFAAGAAAQIELHQAGSAPRLLAEFEAPLERLQANPQVSLSIPPRSDPQDSRYEIRIHSPQAALQVLGRLEDVYGAGEADIDGDFLLGDAAFFLQYEYGWRHALIDLRRLFSLLWLALPLAAVLLLPGWLLLDACGLSRRFDWGEQVGISIGISLASIPVVVTWTGLVGLRWSRSMALAAAGVLTALALYRLWKKLKPAWQRTAGREAPRSTQGNAPPILAALVVVFAITLFVRFAMARDLSAPPWVDSIHHALVTQAILDEGAFPKDYNPYIPIDAASYHPGFHSTLAAFLWLSGMDMLSGMLIFGQILNALIVFPVYLFTTTLTHNRLAGLLAALAAGIFSPMPAYYTSWGRYTQLAGLEILPAALALLLLTLLPALQSDIPPAGSPAVPRSKLRWAAPLLAALVWAGLFLTHYRVAAFLGLLLLCLLLAAAPVQLFRRTSRRLALQSARAAILPGATFAAAALAFVLPVLLPSIGALAPKVTAWQPSGEEPFSGVGWDYIHAAWGRLVTILAGLGFVWSLVRRKTFGAALLLWMAALFLAANLGAFGLPGSGFINSTAATISLFLPLSALGGYGLAESIEGARHWVPERWQRAFDWGLALTGLALAILAARPLLTLLNPVTFLYRPGDRAAIQWAAENLPPGETVLVNPFAWGYGQYAGNDGGYWLSALAKLPTLPPPVLYGLSNDPQYFQRVNTLSQQAIDLGSRPQELHQMLVRESINYVFIGGRGGPISPAVLRGSSEFALRFAQDGAFIFEVLK